MGGRVQSLLSHKPLLHAVHAFLYNLRRNAIAMQVAQNITLLVLVVTDSTQDEDNDVLNSVCSVRAYFIILTLSSSG